MIQEDSITFEYDGQESSGNFDSTPTFDDYVRDISGYYKDKVTGKCIYYKNDLIF